MEIISLSGGLGNQMFQYAFYLSKRANNKTKVIWDDSALFKEKCHNGFELDVIFGIENKKSPLYIRFLILFVRKIYLLKRTNKYPILSLFLFRILLLFGISVIPEEKDGIYNSNYLIPRKGLSIYFGYWQTEKYFHSIRDVLEEKFSFKMNNISPATQQMYHLLQEKNSVSIHIRRGDFISQEYLKTHGLVCDKTYYDKAISIVNDKLTFPLFVVFSDDIEWVKTNISIPDPIYIDWNSRNDAWQDMFLMSQCRHNIIANSSFSWWGAWLNQNPDKLVIAPSSFLFDTNTIDTIPDNWIKL